MAINKHTQNVLLFTAFLLCFSSSFLKAQIVINEIQTSNLYGFHDEFYKNRDWIELYNAGSSSVNLNGYSVSNDSIDRNMFTFPDYNLSAGGFVIVLASDTDKTIINTHWETAAKASDSWKYRVNTSSPGTTNWRDPSFSDAAWSSGTGGIGFGDSDDGTTVSVCASVYMRKTFNIPDTSKIYEAVFNMDYDDGFVAYLNGVEIARSNIGTPGNFPAWNQLSPAAWEGVLYQNEYPDSFHLDKSLLRSLLKNGNNVLAVETHNQTASNTDLTSNPFLTFNVANGSSFFGAPPSWFHYSSPNYFHGKFKLSRSGETVFLSNANGYIIDQKATGIIETDNSLARNPNGSNTWCLLQNPTPGSSNNNASCATGYATQPIFSLNPGFYTTTKTLTLTTAFPGGTIRYTTDGSDVTTSSTLYSSAITISSTKTIKARVFASSVLPSPTITHTYFINFDCRLPVYCLTTDPANLNDYNNGIFVAGPDAGAANPHWGANYWKDMDKPVTVEYFERDKSLTFQFNSALAITGGWSRADAQKSLEIKLGDKFGLASINYSLVPVKPWLDKWDNFILCAMGQDKGKCRMRDALMNHIMKDAHTDNVQSEPCLLIINGQNWGLYYTRENDDHHWVETNYGYKEDEVDFLKESYFYPGIEVKRGSDSAYFKMYDYATTVSTSDPAYYSTISSMMDLENMADYFIAETYYPNNDWMGGGNNNLKLWRPRKPDGKFRYLLYDLDFGFGYSGSVTDNVLSTALNASPHNYNSDLFAKFTQNATFKRYFINRYADLINTIYLPSNVTAKVNMFRDTLRHDIHYQNEKWGGADSATWKNNITSMLTFASQRPSNARNIVQSSFSLAGQVTLTLQVSPAGAGRIQISTISPESYPWNGVYFNGNPVTITAIPNPGYTFDHWRSNSVISSNNPNQSVTYNFNTSDVITCYFNGSASTANLVFSEVNFNSDSINNPGDWVELHNMNSTAIDISNWQFRDQADNHTFQMPVNTVIPGNGYLVLASDATKFYSVFPTVTNVIGSFNFDLSNSSEEIRLFDYAGNLHTSMTYADYMPWPTQADGGGYTLERHSMVQSPNDPGNWFAGCMLGSPGRAFSLPPVNVTTLNPGALCQGSSATLNAGAQTGSTFQWKLNNVNIAGATQEDLVVYQSGVYKVIVTSGGCNAVSDSLTVTFNPIEQILSSTSGEGCIGGTVSLSATGTSSLIWYGSAAGGASLFTGSVFTTPSLIASTTYYVEASGPCPSSRVPVAAIVVQTTNPPVAQDVSRCGIGHVNLSATSGSTVYWYDNMTGGTLLDSGSTFTTPTLSLNTTYYAQAGNTCPGARSPATAIINAVTPDPVGTDDSRCGSGTLTLTANISSVRWYDAPSGNLLFTGDHFTTPVLNSTEHYYLQDGTTCPSGFIQIDAVINQITADPVSADVSRCGPGVVNLSATSTENIYWYDAPGGNLLAGNSTFTTPSISNNTTYYVSAGDLCPSAAIPVVAIINAQSLDPVGTDVSICGPGTVTLYSTSPDGIFWYDAVNGNLLASTNMFTTPAINSTTTYWVVAGGVCPSNAIPVVAGINALPVVSLGNDTMISSGATLTLDAGSGFTSYLWTTSETTQTISVNLTGAYSVTVTDANGCQNSDDIVVNIPTGISEIEGSTISVYPNPTHGKCNLILPESSSTYTIKLTDELGRTMLIRKGRGGVNEIDVESFASGIYYLSVSGGDVIECIKMVVK